MRNPILPLLFAPFLLEACGSDTGADPNATMVPVGNSGTVIAATKEGITAFLQTNEHQGWVKEPAVHDSTGPHDKVRSYFNDKYAMARRGSSYPMPVGATSVKELYDGNGAAVTGYAVSVKTKEGAGADTWTWYESFGLPSVAVFGVANGTCDGCHSAGAGSTNDRSLSPVP